MRKKCSGWLTFYAILALVIGLAGLSHSIFVLSQSSGKEIANIELYYGSLISLPVFTLFIISAIGTWFMSKGLWNFNIVILALGILGSLFMASYIVITVNVYVPKWESVFSKKPEKQQTPQSKEKSKNAASLDKVPDGNETKPAANIPAIPDSNEAKSVTNIPEVPNTSKELKLDDKAPNFFSVLNIILAILLTIQQIIFILLWLRYFLKQKTIDKFNITENNQRILQNVITVSYEVAAIFIILIGASYLGSSLGLAVKDLKAGYNIQNLDDYSNYELPTEVFDIHGEKITDFFLIKRHIITYKDLPENLINALVAMEDNRFYDHKGIDTYGMMRAMKTNIIQGAIKQGGSTVTQQLAKLLFTDRQRNLARKFVEIWFTLQIETRFSKQEILEKYFNQIYFGHGVYGVEAASRYFFGKSVKDISVAEAAILVSIPPYPARYSPFKRKEEAKSKQKIVLARMLELGFITQKNIDDSNVPALWANIEERLILQNPRSAWQDRQDKAPYFSEYVRQVVQEDLRSEFGDMGDYLRTGGLTIYTSLDLKKQIMAKKYLLEQLVKQDKVYYNQTKGSYHELKTRYTDTMNFVGLSFLDQKYHFQYKQKEFAHIKELSKELDNIELLGNVFGLDRIDRLVEKSNKNSSDDNMAMKTQGALISISPKNGHVVAMVGGRSFATNNQLNRVFAKRQPGSSFKAFVYGAAFQNGNLKPAEVMEDKMLRYGNWSVHSATNRYYGRVTLREAIKNSINSVAVQVVRRIGPKAVVKFAAPLLGVPEERLTADMSIGLGTSEVSPWEMCRGFSVYANRGKEVIPMPILRIVDRHGNVIKDYENELQLKRQADAKNGKSDQLITPQLAYIMSHCMMDVINFGTGKNAKASGFRRMAAGKTGTTQKSKDVWFVGFSANLCTAVWVGFDRGMSLGSRQYGGTVAAPVWGKFMKYAHRDLPRLKFRNPGNLGMSLAYGKTAGDIDKEEANKEKKEDEVDKIVSKSEKELKEKEEKDKKDLLKKALDSALGKDDKDKKDEDKKDEDKKKLAKETKKKKEPKTVVQKEIQKHMQKSKPDLKPVSIVMEDEQLMPGELSPEHPDITANPQLTKIPDPKTKTVKPDPKKTKEIKPNPKKTNTTNQKSKKPNKTNPKPKKPEAVKTKKPKAIKPKKTEPIKTKTDRNQKKDPNKNKTDNIIKPKNTEPVKKEDKKSKNEAKKTDINPKSKKI